MDFPERASLTEHADHLEFELLPVTVYFVHQEGVEYRAALFEAFTTLVQKRNGTFRVEWLHEERIPLLLATIKNPKDAVFVCEEFQGWTFSLLRRQKFKVLGPECITNQENSLKASDDTSFLPLYTVLMQGMTICFSGLSSKQMKILGEKIILMGGSFTGPLRSSVTHLVADRVGSAKYFTAARLGIKIMHRNWIEELWKQALLGSYTDREEFLNILLEEQSLPYLKGITIYICPFLDKKTGGSYQGLIKTGGGTLCSDPIDASITHYVTEELNLSTVVPSYVQVRPKWLLDCARSRLCRDWNDYLIQANSPARVTSVSRKSLAKPLPANNRKRPLPSPSSPSTTSTPKKQSSGLTCSVNVSPIRDGRVFLVAPTEKTAVVSSKPAEATDRPLPALTSISTRIPVHDLQSSKLFHDENARDGLSEDISPLKAHAKEDQLSVDTNGAHSTCDVLFSSSPVTGDLAGSPFKFAPEQSQSSSSDSNLARIILDMVSNGKSLATRTPLKLSREKMLRQGRYSLGRGSQLSLKSPILQIPEESSGLTYPSAVDWEEELSNGASGDVPDKFSPPSSLEEPPAKTAVFMFCRLKEYDPEQMSKLHVGIKSLRCKSLHGITYNPECTHLICDRPYFTEKFLSCCAAGKWILHVQYIHDSVQAGYLLEEEPYEWGNVLAGKLMTGLNDTELRWASACHWWRHHVQQFGKKAFDGWQVILSSDIPRLDSYSNVLRAGNGVIVPSVPGDAGKATHLLHNFVKTGEEEKLKEFQEGFEGLTATVYDKGYLDRYLLQKAIGAAELRRAMTLSASLPRRMSQMPSRSSRSTDRLSVSSTKRPRLEASYFIPSSQM